MADDATPQDEQRDEPEAPQAEAAAEETPQAEEAAPAEEPAAEAEAEQPAAEAEAPAEAEAEAETDAPAAEAEAEEEDDEEPETPRVKPAIPGMDLQPDIVPEGVDPLARAEAEAEEEAAAAAAAEDEEIHDQPVAATIDLGASARYTATGKRKTAIARVILKPGSGAYTINGKTLDEYFPRATLQKNIRQPLEAVGYEDRMDVIATMTGGGVSAQAGALRHGISRALLEADPNLRGELKRRGFLTRDSRAKERKKAGLKKARKRPQFSKR